MPQPLRRDAAPLLPLEERQPLRLNASDRQRVVVRFLKGLATRERQILSLRFFERLGDEDIASITSLARDEVHARLRGLLCGVEAALVAEDDALWRQFGRNRRRA
jgi:DNA-directed RNA polymerase specialized sigma24 family protein